MNGDPNVERLLEEIRDLLRRQVDNSERAIANQTESIQKQRQAVDLYRKVIQRLALASIPLVVLLVFLVVWLFRSPLFP